MAAAVSLQNQGSEPAKVNDQSSSAAQDPFASQREDVVSSTPEATSPVGAGSPQDRRLSSDEWDAAKTKPSAFQKRKGSIYATPSSRDGHVDQNYGRDAAFHKKHTEKGYGK